MRVWRFHIYDVAIVVLIAILIWRHLPQEPGLEAWKAANLHMMRGEYTQAVDRFDEVIQVRPEADRAYFYRGIALYYLGRWGEAEAEFTHGLSLKGSDSFMLFWRYMARERQGGGGDAALRSGMIDHGLDSGTWPGILGAALLGDAKENEVLTLAAGMPTKERAGHLAEAYFYLGQRRLFDGDDVVARALFRRALETNANNYLEYLGAAEELKGRKSLPGTGGRR